MSIGFKVGSPQNTASVIVTSQTEHRIRSGQLWIYRSDVAEVNANAGDIVKLIGSRGDILGYGLFSDRSSIAVRLLTHDQYPPDAIWWKEKLVSALRYRKALEINATAFRLVHGEGDLLPSLVVDRYGDVLVLQALSQGIERHTGLIREILIELVRPTAILAKNDSQVRALEGLPRSVNLLYGKLPGEIIVFDGVVQMVVDLLQGEKTGLYLDQRENHIVAAQYAQGRALDCFSYSGGFALHLANRCDQVLAVDISKDAVAAISKNASLNRLTNIQPQEANVFDLLRDLERTQARFDMVILDPPAFAKSRASLSKALAGYKEINLRALKLLSPGGILMTCSCSHYVDEAAFNELVIASANDARVQVVLVEKRIQSRDHPVLVSVPATSYLKCLVLRRLH